MVNHERLLRSLNPKSIAVIGGKEAEKVIDQCLKFGFDGEIWPINPKRKFIAGIACFNSLEELAGAPDMTFIAIPADSSILTIKQLSEMGAGGAVCYASGFREIGRQGIIRHESLLEAAGEMPVFGPNCHGYLNAITGAALWPDQHGLERCDSGVAIISSSGNVAINMTLQQRGLPIAWLVTVGNQAQIGIEECISAALENDKISAIGIHIEGLNNLGLFVELADKARQLNKPIIALKTGKSDIGARITLSHTATLAGGSGLYSALFDRLGIGQIETLEEFIETLKLAMVIGPLPGNKIASMSCSGGEASLIADLSANKAVEFPKLSTGHAKSIKETLNDYVNIDNPLDYHTFIWGDFDRMVTTFSAMISGGFDLSLLMLDFPNVNNCDPKEWYVTLEALIQASNQTGSKVAMVSSFSENMTPLACKQMIENGIAPLQGMSQALAAIEAVSKIGTSWRSEWHLPMLEHSGNIEATDVFSLDENQGKKRLSESGLSVPKAILVSNQSAACEAAREIGYPVVLKVVSDQIAHKSEMNGVIVGINSDQDLNTHVRRLLSISKTMIVEQMVESAVAELLIGISYDPLFGHYLILGFGGTMVELIEDREILLLPVNRNDIICALKKLKTWPLLDGFRGRASADVEAVINAVIKIVEFVEDNKEKLVELEINPLLVKKAGEGAVVADALIRMKQ